MVRVDSKYIHIYLYQRDLEIWPGAGEIMELAGAREYHDSNFCVAKDRQLFRFLQQSIPPLWEGHLPACRVVNPSYHYLPPPHFLHFQKILILKSLYNNQQRQKER